MTSKENRRSPRYTPTSQVSVMLYRDNARPRGCYVGNYSKHGVILKCSALETDAGKALQIGDEVSLHFWDRGKPGHSIKVAGHIVRFGENQVAIEYASPSSASLERLLTLLDQRIEQQPSLEEDTMEDLPKLRLPGKPRPQTADETEIFERRSVEPTIHEGHESVLGPGLMLGLLIAAIVGIVGLGFYSFRLSDQLYELNETVTFKATQTPANEDVSAVADLTKRVVAIEDLTQQIAIEDLTQRITAIEDKQQNLSASLEQLVKRDDLQAAVDKLNARIRASQQKVAPATPATDRKTEPEAATPAPTGQWVIHLAALSDEGAVDKFITKAKSMGIDVQKEQITVNEKRMYRLSIPGLASYDEAEKLAGNVQKKMALRQKPWIAKK